MTVEKLLKVLQIATADVKDRCPRNEINNIMEIAGMMKGV